MNEDTRRRALALGALIGVVVIALALGAHHAGFVAADTVPGLDEDSPGHMVAHLSGWHALRWEVSYETVWPPGTYPPMASWVAWAWFLIDGPSLVGLLESQVAFTVVAAVGTGAFAWRAGGRGAALAAASLTASFPWVWAQRSNVMLMLAAMAGVAVALAVSPSSAPRRRLGLAAGGGLLAGLGMLGHNAAAYTHGALALALCVEVGVRLARRETRAAGWIHLQNVAAWGASAAVAVALWWWPNRLFLFGVTHDDGRADRAMDATSRVDILGTFLHEFLLGWHVVLLLPGLVLAVALAWRRPLLGRAAVVFVGGYIGIDTWPSHHERFYLILIPAMCVLMVAPVVVVERARPLWRQALGLALGGLLAWAGLWFSAGWSVPGQGPWHKLELGRIQQTLERSSTDAESKARLLAPPENWQTLAPSPMGGQLDPEVVITALLDDAGLPTVPDGPPPSASAPITGVMVGSTIVGLDSWRLLAVAISRGEYRLRPAPNGQACTGPGSYAVAVGTPLPRGRVVESWPVVPRGWTNPETLTLVRCE